MRMTEQEAYKLATKLKDSMENPNIWTVKVHENLGWHYRIICGHIGVHSSGDKYYAMVGSIINKDCGGTPAFWADDKRYDDPQVAAEKAVQKAIDASMEYLTTAVAAKVLLQ